MDIVTYLKDTSGESKNNVRGAFRWPKKCHNRPAQAGTYYSSLNPFRYTLKM